MPNENRFSRHFLRSQQTAYRENVSFISDHAPSFEMRSVFVRKLSQRSVGRTISQKSGIQMKIDLYALWIIHSDRSDLLSLHITGMLIGQPFLTNDCETLTESICGFYVVMLQWIIVCGWILPQNLRQ